MPSKKRKSSAKKLGELLVLCGGIISLLFGVLYVANLGALISFIPSFDLSGVFGTLTTIICGIILILLSLIVLATSGVVDIPALKLENSWVILLILGILMFVFGGSLGGILVIVGAILFLF